MRWLLLVILVACKTPPLSEGILGEWESWCVNEKDTAGCLSKDRDASRMTFGRDGTLTVKTDTTDMTGHWELHGSELVMSLETYGQKFSTKFRARIEDGRLVLTDSDHAEVYGRVGATFEAADSPTTNGDPVVRKLQGVTYTLPLPAGYRLGDASEHEETWMPKHGDGFTVSVKISDRGSSTCKEFGGGEGGGSETKNGVEHQIYFDIMTCIEGTPLYASCRVEHTRGYVEESEKDAALALCKPLKLAH